MEGRYQQRRRRDTHGREDRKNRPNKDNSGRKHACLNGEKAPESVPNGKGGTCSRKKSTPPPIPPAYPRKASENREGQRDRGAFPPEFLPQPLNTLLSGTRSGDLMALMILLLLLWEGKEDSQGTILTLLIFLLL